MENKKYEQKPLRYAMDALEPVMSKSTLEYHYGRHHVAYIGNLNAALEKEPSFEAPACIGRLIHHLHHVPESIRAAVRNNGGGHFNHSFFWKTLTAPKEENKPCGELAAAIVRDFGSVDALKEKFNAAALGHFGSGWAWLILKKDCKLAVCSTPNQDCPLMPESVVPGIEHGRPIIALDLWEHSYYLQYQNRKAEYVKSFWSIVDWEQAERNYCKALEHRRAKEEGKQCCHKGGCCEH